MECHRYRNNRNARRCTRAASHSTNLTECLFFPTTVSSEGKIERLRRRAISSKFSRDLSEIGYATYSIIYRFVFLRIGNIRITPRYSQDRIAINFDELFLVSRCSLSKEKNIGKIVTMNKYPGKMQSVHENNHRASTMIDHGFATRKIRTSYPSSSIDTAAKEDSLVRKEYEILRISQASMLSTCMLLLSYHSIRYGRTEYSILRNGKIIEGYAHKAIITLSLGYSVPYSVISFLAIGMLAYSIVSKKPRWSLPSIVLYLTDLVYDAAGAFVLIWLLFSNLSVSMAFSYAIGTILLILGEFWIWLGVVRLYEQRTFKGNRNG